MEKSGRFYANRKFLFDILTIVPLKFIIGGNLASKPSIFLLGTNLRIARRNLAKNGLYSFINVFGLSISFTACILITLFVRDELSFDRHYPDNERIFRIAGQYSQREGQSSPAASTSYLLLPTIEGVPGIEKICRLDFRFDIIAIDGDKQYIEPEIVYADSTFFDIFSLPFIMGNSSTALDDPNSVVLDETTAKKYFGAENPLDKSIQLNDKLFNVSGVIKDFPPNSHFTARLIFPISGIELWYADWVKTNFSGTGKYTYFKAAENFNEEEFVTTVNKLFAARWPNDKPPTFFLQPLTSIQ